MLFSLLFAGCGGGGNNNAPGTWALINQETLTLAPGGVGSAAFTFQNKSEDATYQLTIRLDGTAPNGWTVTGSSMFLDKPIGKTVDLEVEVRVPANAPNGQRFLPLVITDDDPTTEDVSVSLTVTVGQIVVTSIRETAAFVPNLDGRFESGLEITNGETNPIATLVEPRPLNFVGEVDALVWFSPKAGGFVADPGGVETMKCSALPRTNTVAKTFSLENYFLNPWQGGREEKYSTQFSVKPPNDVLYTITSLDWLMGVRMSDPDKVTTYDVTFDPVPTGKAGLYTFSVANLDTTQYTAVVNPPNAPVNAFSAPVTVAVTITRIGDGTGETVDEFTLRATHDVHADVNGLLRLPIRTYVGR